MFNSLTNCFCNGISFHIYHVTLWGSIGLSFAKLTIIHWWLCTVDTLQSIAVHNDVNCDSLQAAKYTMEYTSSLVRLCSQVRSQNTPKYTLCTLPSTSHSMISSTPGHPFVDVPNYTWWHIHCLFDGTLPTELSIHSQVYTWVCFPVHSL